MSTHIVFPHACVNILQIRVEDCKIPATPSATVQNPRPTFRWVSRRLQELSNPVLASHAARFFKTGPGEYGEGDCFRGIRVPALRALVREVGELPLPEVLKILQSRYHEDRLWALLMLVRLYQRGSTETRETIFRAYLTHTRWINNWDLVDCSAHLILGVHLRGRSLEVLDRLAESTDLWERRMAILATFDFIRRGDLGPTFALAERLCQDPEDLMHKAVGWMLREAGKRDETRLRDFLDRHAATLPRTLLRYAIEKFSPVDRADYLSRRGVR